MIETKYKLRYIPVEQIELWSDANSRKLDVQIDLDELANNIDAVGLQNPIVVQEVIPNKKYKIISGQRRWLACNRIGLSEIPAIISPKMNLVDAKIASLSENVYRKKMNEQDISDVTDYLYKRLGSINAVAKKLGVSSQTVSKYIGFSKVPDEIKQLVQNKDLTVGQAMNIYSKYAADENHAAQIARNIAKIKDKSEKRSLVNSVKISVTAKEDFETIKRRAKDMQQTIEYTIHLPPRTSIALEKAARDNEQDIEDLIIDAIEKWLAGL